jgi:hypothetical protein
MTDPKVLSTYGFKALWVKEYTSVKRASLPGTSLEPTIKNLY